MLSAKEFYLPTVHPVYFGETLKCFRDSPCLELLVKAKFQHTRVAHYVEGRSAQLINELKKLFSEWAHKAAKTAQQLYVQSGLGKIDKATEDLIARIIDEINAEGFSTDIVDEITPEMQRAFRKAGIASLAQVNIDVSDAIIKHLDKAAKAFAAERGAELVGKRIVDGEVVDNPNKIWSITETMRDDLRQTVEEAVTSGASSERLSNSIEDSFSFSEERANTIARTELAKAYVEGNAEGYRQSGVVDRKEWILGDNHAIDDECDDAVADGVIPFEDAFSNGLMFPPAHPNCVCDVLPVLSEEEPE